MTSQHLVFAAILGLAVAPSAILAVELPAEEKAKIEKLIEHVKGLKDAVFIRYDLEYDAAAAAKFLHAKWLANASEIQTARQFIDKAASGSSTTGKPYLIRFKDRKEVKSGDYLKERLKTIE